MWDSEQFAEYLRDWRTSPEWPASMNDWPMEPWERVQQRMKAAVYASMESVADHVEHRPNTFELFGYDFMVCEQFDVWLIEVNSSPDLSSSTSTTRTLVKQVIEDMMTLVVDVEQMGLPRKKKKWSEISDDAAGRFELLEPKLRVREEKFNPPGRGEDLRVVGEAARIRRPGRKELAALEAAHRELEGAPADANEAPDPAPSGDRADAADAADA